MTKRNVCAEVADRLPAYVRETLPSVEMRFVTDHLDQCHACRRALREWQQIIAAANVAASRSTPSPEILSRAWARIDSPEDARQSQPQRVTAERRRWFSPVFPASAGSGRLGRQPRDARAAWSRAANFALVGIVIAVIAGAVVNRDPWENLLGDQFITTTHQATPAAQVVAMSTQELATTPPRAPTATREKATVTQEPATVTDMATTTSREPATTTGEATKSAREPIAPTHQTATAVGEAVTETRVAPDHIAASIDAPDGLSFVSILSNETSHPGASLRLSRLIMDPGSSTAFEVEDSPVTLLVEEGMVHGVVDGPATVRHGAECELAGHTEELTAGDQFELRSSDLMLVPIGTSPELHNRDQQRARLIDLRIHAPGPPPQFRNGVEYLRLAQVSANQLPSSQIEFSLVEGSFDSGAVHDINGPGLFYLESGTVEIVDSSANLVLDDDDDQDDEPSANVATATSVEVISGGEWFFLESEERASLTAVDGDARYLELLFDPE